MKESQKSLLRRAEDVGALRRGHFVLNGGEHSDTFFDADEMFVRPGRFALSTAWDILRCLPEGLEIDAIVGPADGATVLVQWLGIAWAHDRRCRDVIAMSVREQEDGRVVLRESQTRHLMGKKILVADDVLTTGETLRKVIAALEGFPCRASVVGAAVIVNRNQVTHTRLGVPFLVAALPHRIQSFPPDAVPSWLKAIPVEKELGQGS